jgi:hypothetical protein
VREILVLLVNRQIKEKEPPRRALRLQIMLLKSYRAFLARYSVRTDNG